ncbi:MAG TPA: hypothetical protein VFP49_03845 [Nitrososphaeraceae archaeon]|jgi:hypothetical protein|nr:hypothetical protein [Nitrososphaeraceae archaeon]
MIIQSQRVKKTILTALADEEMTKILDSVMSHSKSIANITREYITISFLFFITKIDVFIHKQYLLYIYRLVILLGLERFINKNSLNRNTTTVRYFLIFTKVK